MGNCIKIVRRIYHNKSTFLHVQRQKSIICRLVSIYGNLAQIWPQNVKKIYYIRIIIGLEKEHTHFFFRQKLQRLLELFGFMTSFNKKMRPELGRILQATILFHRGSLITLYN
jgi:hypothetical protein